MRVSAVRGSVLYISLASAITVVTMSHSFADDERTDPFLGQPHAITAGKVICAS
jgi:hypothetical protein